LRIYGNSLASLFVYNRAVKNSKLSESIKPYTCILVLTVEYCEVLSFPIFTQWHARMSIYPRMEILSHQVSFDLSYLPLVPFLALYSLNFYLPPRPIQLIATFLPCFVPILDSLYSFDYELLEQYKINLITFFMLFLFALSIQTKSFRNTTIISKMTAVISKMLI
jgi:hypothetical protein